jgi:hypothetical protein
MSSVQTLINNAIAYKKRVVNLPAGNLPLMDTVKIYDTQHFTINGHANGTTLVYKGPPGKPALDYRGAYWPTLRNVSILSDVEGALTGVQISSIPSGLLHNGKPWGLPTTHALFDRVFVVNSAQIKPFKYSFLVGSDIVREYDKNNDWHEWKNCNIGLFSEDGVRITGGQAHALYFDRCTFSGYAGGKRCIHGEYGNFFTVNECGGGGVSDVDFLLSDFIIKVVIKGWNSEHSRQLLRTGGPSGSAPVVTLDGIRYAKTAAHNVPLVDYRMSGRFTLSNSTITCGEPPKFWCGSHNGSFKFDSVNTITSSEIPDNYSIMDGYGSAKSEDCKISSTATTPWKRYLVPTNAKDNLIPINFL